MKLKCCHRALCRQLAEFSSLHPFAPLDQAQGYLQVFAELETPLLCDHGFAGASLFRPNSGGQGEYTGLLVIRAYHADHNQSAAQCCVDPSSAHGTNPASAVMAGLKVFVVQCDANGNIDLADCRRKRLRIKTTGRFDVTYPIDPRVFEEAIKGHLRTDPCKRRTCVYGWRQHECAGRPHEPCDNRAMCVHINLPQNIRDSTWRRRSRVGPICVAEILVPYLPGIAGQDRGGESHSMLLHLHLVECQCDADFLRIHCDDGWGKD